LENALKRNCAKRIIFAVVAMVALLACNAFAGFQPPPLLPEPHKGGVVFSPDGKASLTINEGIHILKLSGTHYEMGFNHGYLLAPEIINVFTHFGFWIAAETKQDYGKLIRRQELFDWGEYEEELKGMLDGLRAALPKEKLIVSPPGQTARPIELADLKIGNSMGDLMIDIISCSSFSIWGAGRKDGSALLARNFDWLTDPQNTIMNHQAIISYDPADGARWVNVTFAGDIGCISGMNEYGISAVIHVILNGYKTSDKSGFVPGTIALRKVIESLNASGSPADADKILDKLPMLGDYAYHIVFPSSGRTDDQVAGIFEYDGKADHPDGRDTYRKPSDNSRLPKNAVLNQRLDFNYAMINVNHYLMRKHGIPFAESPYRYASIKRKLKAAKKDGNVDVEEARKIMASVGFKPSVLMGRWISLHTTIFEPDTRMLHLYFSKNGRPGYENPRMDFAFTDLF